MANTSTQSPAPARMTLDGDVAIVTIQNPPLNLLDNETKGLLLDIFRSLRQYDDVRAVLIHASGTKAFSAGADITEFPQRIADDNALEVARSGHNLITAIRECRQPTVSVADGVAYGAGLEVMLATDFRLATSRATFALPEVTRGVFPGNGGTQLLPRIVGSARALDLMLSGSPIDATEALRIGLITRIVAAEESTEAALRFARRLAGLPAPAVASIRELVRAAVEEPLESGLSKEAGLFAQVFRTVEVLEGVDAFQDKRAPDFRRVATRRYHPVFDSAEVPDVFFEPSSTPSIRSSLNKGPDQ